MIDGLIQADFGGFDPRFAGITVRFDANFPEVWDAFNQINLLDRDPQQVVALGDRALTRPVGEAFELFAIGTVMIHELRHFHDFLLGSHGQHLFRLRLGASLNAVQAASMVGDERRTLPVPVVRWRHMTEKEKANLTTSLNAWTPPGLTVEPLAFPNEAEELSDLAETAYATINDLVRGPDIRIAGVRLHPSHILETTAMLVQWQNVYNVFGAAHADLFINTLIETEGASSYTLLYRLFDDLWGRVDEPMDIQTVCAAGTWALLGDYQKDGWAAAPNARLSRLWDTFVRDGLPDRGTPVHDLLSEWDRRLSDSTIEAAITKTREANLRFAAQIAGFTHGPREQRELVQPIADLMKMLAEAQLAMTKIFLEDPDAYVNPYQYSLNAANWVAAPIRLSFDNGGLVDDSGRFQGRLIRKARQTPDGKLVVSECSVGGRNETIGRTFIDPVTAFTVADYVTLADFFYARFRRDDPAFDIVRQVLAEDGKIAIEIIE